MSPGRETSRTQSCLKHLRPGSERPIRLVRTRHPSATAPITCVPVGDARASAPAPFVWRSAAHFVDRGLEGSVVGPLHVRGNPDDLVGLLRAIPLVAEVPRDEPTVSVFSPCAKRVLLLMGLPAEKHESHSIVEQIRDADTVGPAASLPCGRGCALR